LYTLLHFFATELPIELAGESKCCKTTDIHATGAVAGQDKAGGTADKVDDT